MDIKKLIEEINILAEDELIDDFEGIDVPNEPVEMSAQPFDLTSELNAKTKISRALDVLIDAIDDFKNSITEEIDLIEDADLTSSFELLDEVVSQIQDAISGNNAQDTMLNDIEQEEQSNEEQASEDEEDEESEIDFDAEAELDLFSDEETESEE